MGKGWDGEGMRMGWDGEGMGGSRMETGKRKKTGQDAIGMGWG